MADHPRPSGAPRRPSASAGKGQRVATGGEGEGTRPRRRDLTTGAIAPTLLAFALPTLGANILQSLNGSINTIWVGRFIGEGAVAATANANTIMFLMFAAVFGFGMAATILIGQSMGRRDIDGARRAFGAAIGLVVGISIVIAFAGWTLSPAILRVLATPQGAMPYAVAYLRVIFLGLPPAMLLVLLGMSLRGVGDSITPLWFTALSVALDSGLNPVFIKGLAGMPALGIAGSATATLIASYASSLGLLWWVYHRDLAIRLRGAELAYLMPSLTLARTIVVKGLPMGAQMLVVSFAGLTMTGLVNRFGVDTAAAYGVSMQLWAYIQMPALAIGAAVSGMVAQNIGAGQWDRVGRITGWGLAFSIGLTTTMVGLILLFDRPVMALFLGGDSPAEPIARHIQLVASWNFIVFGMTMVLFATVRANGAVWAPLIMIVIAMFPVRVGFATGLRDMLGADALWWSFPLGSIANLIMATVYYRFGDWRRFSMQVPPEEVAEQAHTAGEPQGRLHPAG